MKVVRDPRMSKSCLVENQGLDDGPVEVLR